MMNAPRMIPTTPSWIDHAAMTHIAMATPIHTAIFSSTRTPQASQGVQTRQDLGRFTLGRRTP